ncbi:uncharacterized protein LOC135248994 isoform X5 [Anguilla rostrata]|uniref:uncharacterized protein LOC135248994 isoform X5 n=1 Tax=Anguilla rostrata TaxID=7938 RepID=UPI0030D3A90B
MGGFVLSYLHSSGEGDGRQGQHGHYGHRHHHRWIPAVRPADFGSVAQTAHSAGPKAINSPHIGGDVCNESRHNGRRFERYDGICA